MIICSRSSLALYHLDAFALASETSSLTNGLELGILCTEKYYCFSFVIPALLPSLRASPVNRAEV